MAEAEKTYRIHGVEVENFQRIKIVSIKPGGGVVQITGKNGHGKSSFLAALGAAIEGEGAIKLEPIRQGKDDAIIRLDLGDVKITRKFKRTNDEQRAKTGKSYVSSVVVESAEGARWPSPQKMLDSLYGALAFDPMEFMRMDGKHQFDLLKTFVPGFDFAASDRLIAGLKLKRRDVGRDADTARAQAHGCTFLSDDPTERIDESAILTEMEQASTRNTEIERQRVAQESAKSKAHDLRQDAQKLIVEAAGLRDRATALDAQAKAAVEQAEGIETSLASAVHPPLVDVAGLRDRLDNARRHNMRVDRRETRAKLDATAATLSAEYDAITAQIEDREKAKRDTVAAAKMPVEGLSFGDETVLLNGLPLDQASGRDQIIISAKIAAAKSPRLRVMRIKNGNDLDEDGMKVLEQFAETDDMQIIVERIAGTGGVAFELVDGHLKDGPEEPTPQTPETKAETKGKKKEPDDFAEKRLV